MKEMINLINSYRSPDYIGTIKEKKSTNFHKLFRISQIKKIYYK